MTRRTPYTETGIKRVKCAVEGCKNEALYHFQICADNRAYRAVCPEHDVAINEAVMHLVFGREKAKGPLARYRKKVLG